MAYAQQHCALCRQVIAEAVTSDPSTYNEAFLGKPTQEYARWILDPSKWGGAIELSILSKCACCPQRVLHCICVCFVVDVFGPASLASYVRQACLARTECSLPIVYTLCALQKDVRLSHVCCSPCICAVGNFRVT